MPSLDLNLPGHFPDYISDDLIHQAKLQALSYHTNPHNLESMYYGVQNETLTRLATGYLVTTPQYIMSKSREKAHEMLAALVEEADKKQKARDGNNPRAEMARRFTRSATHASEVALLKLLGVGPDRVSDIERDQLGYRFGCGEDDGDHSDRISIASMRTITMSVPIIGIPDFVQSHNNIIHLSTPASEAQEPTPPPGIRHDIEQAPAPLPDRSADSARRHAQAYHLYDCEYLVRKNIDLVEEDKRGPRGSAHWISGPNPRDPEIPSLLLEAEQDLCSYLFNLFYLQDPHLKAVVARATAGVFWRWACFTRDEIPLHDMPTINSALRVASQYQEEKEKLVAYTRKWKAQPIHVVGGLESDGALTAMRDQIFQNIRDYSPIAFLDGQLVWGHGS
ncbi:hypothetical protein HDZ31DRAFT_66756 [Schizophyllum fasciatum]